MQLQNAISGAIGKLQLYVQQLDATIEHTTQQIIQNQTEVVGQSKTLHTQCLNFREKMNDLEKDIFLNNTESETALCNLERLDNLKTKLMVDFELTLFCLRGCSELTFHNSISGIQEWPH